MNRHALLSASSSHRWLNCTPSAKLEQEFEDTTSEAAEEGTAAHALCEYKLKVALGFSSVKPVSKYECEEMNEYCDGYVQFILELLQEAKQYSIDAKILIEQHLDFSSYVPDGFGTGDCIVLSDGELHIVDFKYGQGVLVSAINNPQMMLYAIGALGQYSNLYEIEEVSMTIYQPRRENISTWTIKVDELMNWAETELKCKAQLAFNGKGAQFPGEWCGFCKARVKCRARAEEKLKLTDYDFRYPPLLTDEEIEDILSKLENLTKWANEIMDYATDSAINHEKQWSGFKLVEGRSNRKYADEEKVQVIAKENGYEDIYKNSLITITEMERMMGKKTFSELLGNLIIRPKGKLILVPDSDKRSAIDTRNIKNEFNLIMED